MVLRDIFVLECADSVQEEYFSKSLNKLIFMNVIDSGGSKATENPVTQVDWLDLSGSPLGNREVW